MVVLFVLFLLLFVQTYTVSNRPQQWTAVSCDTKKRRLEGSTFGGANGGSGCAAGDGSAAGPARMESVCASVEVACRFCIVQVHEINKV